MSKDKKAEQQKYHHLPNQTSMADEKHLNAVPKGNKAGCSQSKNQQTSRPTPPPGGPSGDKHKNQTW